MQKIISIMIIALMAFGLAACADVSHNNTTAEEAIVEETKENASSDETATTEETVSDETTIVEESNQSLQEPVSISSEKKVLVVYFSVTGNTKNIAENVGSGKWIEGKRFDAKVSEEDIINDV